LSLGALGPLEVEITDAKLRGHVLLSLLEPFSTTLTKLIVASHWGSHPLSARVDELESYGIVFEGDKKAARGKGVVRMLVRGREHVERFFEVLQMTEGV
jgi:hypothetical protein